MTVQNPVEQGSPAVRPGGWSLWLRWVLAHVLILGVVLTLGIWLASTTYYSVGGLVVLPLIIVAPFVAQWIGLRQVLGSRRETWLWVLATFIGLMLAGLIVT